MTIVEAIREILRKSDKPLTHKEIYKSIVAADLYVFSAKDPVHVVRSTLRRHCVGLNFPSSSPVKHFKIAQTRGKSVKYSLKDADVPEATQEGRFDKAEQIPEEIVQDAYESHLQTVKSKLLETIQSAHPAFFEKLVIELLLKMGYGAGRPDAGLVTGRPGDGGIDGIIYEDPLELGKIYVQAKRKASDYGVTADEVKAFMQNLLDTKKGVFLTTSYFTKPARRAGSDDQSKQVALIDGDRLCDLLIEHGLGVRVEREFATYSIDDDFFIDD